MQALPFDYARKTIKNYGCSACWGDLEMNPDPENPNQYIVTCKTCKEETRGYVTKYYIERRRSESVGEERDVKKLLIKQNILPDPLAGKSKADLIHELGF